jgi:hypothetical protein
MGLARPIAFSPRAKLDVNRLHFGRAIFGQNGPSAASNSKTDRFFAKPRHDSRKLRAEK